MSTTATTMYARNQKNAAKSLAGDTIRRRALGDVINRRIKAKNMSNDEVSKAIGAPVTQVSRIRNGHVAEFSADRLARFATKLGLDIVVTVVAREKGRGTAKIVTK